jgi:hypothetical protein
MLTEQQIAERIRRVTAALKDVQTAGVFQLRQASEGLAKATLDLLHLYGQELVNLRKQLDEMKAAA